MRFGLHVSVGKGLSKGAEAAIETACETIQFFSGSPTRWQPSQLKATEVEVFLALVAEHDLWPIFLHTPYLVNLASSEPDIWQKSVALMVNAVEKAATLGAGYVVTHVGSHRGAGLDVGIGNIGRALHHVFAVAPPGVMVVLEGETGAGSEIGATFEEMAQVLEALSAHEAQLGVCLDTAHLWAVGYDLSTAGGVEATLAHFDELIGLERLKLIHANDNERGLGSRTDKHATPGEGQIGLECFRILVNLPALAQVPVILEKPWVTLEDDRQALALMRWLVRG